MRKSPLLGIQTFGLLYGFILLLIVVPAANLYPLMVGAWPWGRSIGLPVRITNPPRLLADLPEERVIVSVKRAAAEPEPELRLNSKWTSLAGLGGALRAELSRRANRVVYVDGEKDLSFADVARVVEIARDAWPGVPVVLLTPRLRRTLTNPPGTARPAGPVPALR